MKYVSTRDTSKTFEFKDVFIKGLADDGGLFVPEALEKYGENEIKKNYWFTLDRDDIFNQTGRKFSNYIIYLNGNYKIPKPRVITAKISNNHKKYAITWFSMAISILLIYLYFRKKNY